MNKLDKFIIISSLICILTCIGEFVTMFIFARYYPGYNHLKDTMSSLGASKSPVSSAMSAWWILMGLLMIVFGLGFKKAFKDKGKIATVASWLIILYGAGEGIGSGLMKADRIANGITFSGFSHDLLGGIGVTSILIFPLLMRKILAKKESASFNVLSIIVFITGILTILLFLFRYSPDENDFFSIYKGLWQRLFMLNTYFYLTWISVLMIKKHT